MIEELIKEFEKVRIQRESVKMTQKRVFSVSGVGVSVVSYNRSLAALLLLLVSWNAVPIEGIKIDNQLVGSPNGKKPKGK